MPGLFMRARKPKDYHRPVGGVTRVTEAVMHRMSFEVAHQKDESAKKSGGLSAILLVATVMLLAWSLEPVLKAILSS